MTDASARIKCELESMGYSPEVESHSPSYPEVVVIEYEVKNGRFRGETRSLGISMSGSEMWPEYPPHFIHLSPPPEPPPRDGAVYGVYPVENRQWIVLSRPPGAFWDSMPTKSMRGYMEHITRFWENI